MLSRRRGRSKIRSILASCTNTDGKHQQQVFIGLAAIRREISSNEELTGDAELLGELLVTTKNLLVLFRFLRSQLGLKLKYQISNLVGNANRSLFRKVKDHDDRIAIRSQSILLLTETGMLDRHA